MSSNERRVTRGSSNAQRAQREAGNGYAQQAAPNANAPGGAVQPTNAYPQLAAPNAAAQPANAYLQQGQPNAYQAPAAQPANTRSFETAVDRLFADTAAEIVREVHKLSNDLNPGLPVRQDLISRGLRSLVRHVEQGGVTATPSPRRSVPAVTPPIAVFRPMESTPPGAERRGPVMDAQLMPPPPRPATPATTTPAAQPAARRPPQISGSQQRILPSRSGGGRARTPEAYSPYRAAVRYDAAFAAFAALAARAAEDTAAGNAVAEADGMLAMQPQMTQAAPPPTAAPRTDAALEDRLPVHFAEVENREYIVRYPENSWRWYVIRCPVPDVDGNLHGFQDHPFLSPMVAGHLASNHPCHRGKQEVTDEEGIVRGFGYLVIGADVTVERVERSNQNAARTRPLPWKGPADA
ncbi:hypothetical protein QBC37DRAFT_450954 [Rhypophila decipiens]|uniref:Uncharacterized protein n=1 Tax=Rhypophila decipiens TaxID=261697 RepID=A0AAN6YD80_9PEZI|nr:hypothetical protein QBC37DRAFT_450954 [Rhypophila decipiens]